MFGFCGCWFQVECIGGIDQRTKSRQGASSTSAAMNAVLVPQYPLANGRTFRDMDPSSRDDRHGAEQRQHQQIDAGEESKSASDGKPERRFPWILHRVLEDAEQDHRQDVVAWTPTGNAFIVRKRDDFMKEILPRYFRQTKFKSFVRQLNLWGFTFIDQGPDKGSCK